MITVISFGLCCGLVGFVIGYYVSMSLWKKVSDTWKYLYFEERKLRKL